MEFSRLGMIRSRISNAAYEGARFAMVQGGTAADAQQAVANSLNVLGVVSPTTTVQFLDETDTQVTPGQATRVNVQVDVPYAPNSFSLGLLPDSISQLQLSAQVTLRTNLQNAE